MIKAKKEQALIFVGFRHKTDSIKSAKSFGYKVILLAKNPSEKANDLFDEIHTFSSSLTEIEMIVNDLKKKYRIKGVLTNYEHYVVLRSMVAELCGVPTTSLYAAACTRNKALQRHALKFLPQNVPSALVEDKTEASAAFKNLDEDVFVKNISGVKSKLIFHVQTEKQMESAIEKLSAGSSIPDEDLYEDYEYMNFNFLYPNPNKQFLVEKTVKGHMASIASLIGNRQVWHAPSMVDIYTAKDIDREDSFLAFRILPSRHKPAYINRVKRAVEGAVGILGLKNCAVHAEFMLDENDNPYLIEIASRLGGYRQDMYKTAFDLDLSDRLIKAVIGKDIRTRKSPKTFVSLVEIFAQTEKTLEKDYTFDDAILLEGIELIFFRGQPAGTKVGPAKLGYPQAAAFMVKCKNYKQLEEFSRMAHKKMAV